MVTYTAELSRRQRQIIMSLLTGQKSAVLLDAKAQTFGMGEKSPTYDELFELIEQIEALEAVYPDEE